MIRLALLVLSALLCAAPASAQQVHKWVDADGKVHYSDRPPPQGKSQTLNIPSASAASAAASEGKSVAEKELEFRKRHAEAEEAASNLQQEEALAKERAQNCAQARQQLASMQSGARISRFNEQGERVYLDDNERQASIEQAQKAVESWCK